MRHGGLEPSRFTWSPIRGGSPTRGRPRRGNNAIFLYDTKSRRSCTPGDVGLSERQQPTFDPDGKYLFYPSDRVRAGLRQLRQLAGRIRIRRSSSPCRCERTSSPLAARTTPKARPSTSEDAEDETEEDDEEAKRRTDSGRKPPPRRPTSTSISTASKRARSCCRRRPATTRCRPSRARCSTGAPRTGSATRRARSSSSISTEREEKTVIDDVDGFEATADGKKLLVSRREVRVLDIKPAQKFEKPMRDGRHGGAGRSARRVAADVRRCLALRARLLLRPEHARRRLDGDCASTTASCSTTRSPAGT